MSSKSTVAGKVDDENVVQSVGRNIDLSSVDSKGPNYQDCEVVVHIDEQPQCYGIAYVVHVNGEDLDIRAGNECRASSSTRSFKRCTSTRVQVEMTTEKDPAVEITFSQRDEERHGYQGERVPRGQRHEIRANDVVWCLRVVDRASTQLDERRNSQSDWSRQCERSAERTKLEPLSGDVSAGIFRGVSTLSLTGGYTAAFR